MERKRYSKHIPSTIKGLNNSGSSGHSGRQISSGEETETLFNKISSTPISTCSTDCPMYKGICTAIGVNAPVGESCIAQEISRQK